MGYYKNKRAGDPKWIAGDEEHDAALAEYGVSVDALSRTSARPIRWLVENIIPHETVTLIAGEAGAGKTFFACQLAADATRVSQMRVVLAISGDESRELLRWRLEKAEGDARRVALAILGPNGFYDKRGNPTAEEIDERMAILYETLKAAGDPKSGMLPAEIDSPDDSFPTPRAAQLLVIDDIDGWFGKPGNLMPAADLARAIQRLNGLARSLRVAVVVLARTQLSVEGRMTSRQLSRLSQAANVVWMVVKDKERRAGGVSLPVVTEIANCKLQNVNCKMDEADDHQFPTPSSQPLAYSQSDRRWFLPVKNNLAADVAVYGRAFEIYDGQIRWHADDPVPSLADALLPSAHNSDRRRVRHAAMLWIKRALADGPLPSKEFYQLGIDNGHSKGTLVRAATELGIHPTKTGFNGGWEMRWVPQPEVAARGTTARLAGAGFKIVGGEGGTKRQGDAGTERQREMSSCESSPECEESCEVVCASSEKHVESEATSCASSTDGEESSVVSCASSTQDRINAIESADPRSPIANCKNQSGRPEPLSSPGPDRVKIHEIIVDALQECLQEAG